MQKCEPCGHRVSGIIEEEFAVKVAAPSILLTHVLFELEEAPTYVIRRAATTR